MCRAREIHRHIRMASIRTTGRWTDRSFRKFHEKKDAIGMSSEVLGGKGFQQRRPD